MKIKNIELIVITLLIIYFIYRRKKNHNIKKDNLIANTEYLKNTKYMKRKIIIYKMINTIINISFIITIITGCIIIGRPYYKYNNKQNEIIFCIDTSSSTDKLNKEVMNDLKRNYRLLYNDQIGIIIFNTSQVTLSPLTKDYNYTYNIINNIEKSIELNNSNKKIDNYYLKNYIISGTLLQANTKGTSLINNGLNYCINSISYKTKNNKNIILITDNKNEGINNISINQLNKKKKKHNIKIYTVIPENIENEEQLQKLFNKTNIRIYKYSNKTIKRIIKNINNNKKKNIYIQDKPTIPFIILFINIIVLIILKKVIE